MEQPSPIICKKNNQKSYFYDPIDLQNISTDSLPCPSMDSLLNTCDIIIGTSGLDALKGIAFDRVSGHKILASASSADVEFASLLKLAEPANNSFETRHVVVHDNLTIDILNGGFPLNFDRQNNATKDEDIVLTWCLMYVGAMQAVKLIEDRKQEGKIYALDRVSQRQILNRWIDDKKAAGAVPPVDKNDVEKIVSYTTKENDPEMPTVWQE